MIKWLDRFGDPEWRKVHKFWSFQIAVFWGVVSGLWAALPAFQSIVPPIPFALGCVGVAVLIAIARYTNQPGMVDD